MPGPPPSLSSLLSSFFGARAAGDGLLPFFVRAGGLFSFFSSFFCPPGVPGSAGGAHPRLLFCRARSFSFFSSCSSFSSFSSFLFSVPGIFPCCRSLFRFRSVLPSLGNSTSRRGAACRREGCRAWPFGGALPGASDGVSGRRSLMFSFLFLFFFFFFSFSFLFLSFFSVFRRQQGGGAGEEFLKREDKREEKRVDREGGLTVSLRGIWEMHTRCPLMKKD